MILKDPPLSLPIKMTDTTFGTLAFPAIRFQFMEVVLSPGNKSEPSILDRMLRHQLHMLAAHKSSQLKIDTITFLGQNRLHSAALRDMFKLMLLKRPRLIMDMLAETQLNISALFSWSIMGMMHRKSNTGTQITMSAEWSPPVDMKEIRDRTEC
jgi:hypothetical protein